MFNKVTIALAAVVALLLIAIIGAYWWANTVPSPPKGIPANAVFLWAPYVGLPGPRRGWWLACREDVGHNYCRLSDVDGNTEYEGEFVAYAHKGSIPADRLRIDPTNTRENKVWVGKALVPLVYLEDGEILIPASKYEEGTRLLDQMKGNR